MRGFFRAFSLFLFVSFLSLFTLGGNHERFADGLADVGRTGGVVLDEVHPVRALGEFTVEMELAMVRCLPARVGPA